MIDLTLVEKSLKNYQREALDFIVASKQRINSKGLKIGALEYDDMGLGKTMITLSSIAATESLPCLIVCPKFGLMVWQTEIEKWLNMDAYIYTGKPKEREAIWADFINSGAKFLITNYAMLPEIAIRSGISLKDVRTAINTPGSFKWQGIVWDEAHMGGLFNQKTSTYKVSAKLSKDIPSRLVLTGTPFRQGCVDFYGPLSLIDPLNFDSYWKYVNKWCTVLITPFGKEIERNPSNVEAFRAMLKKYMIRREKKDVLEELPGKLRQPLVVEMNDEQKKVYDELTSELMVDIPDTDELLITPNQMTLMVRQRQLLACPQVLGLKHRGAAIDAIIEHSHLSMDDAKPIIVYTPFRKAIPYLMEAFTTEYDKCHVYVIQGQMTAEEFGHTWMSFQTDKYKHKVMLCVIKSGASFQATAACTGYFLGAEFDFNLNEQAEDRMYRIGQQDFVNIFYLLHKDTVDDAVMNRLNEKKSASDWVIGSEAKYLKLLQKQRGKK